MWGDVMMGVVGVEIGNGRREIIREEIKNKDKWESFGN
jgi:hypothetical protein